MLSFLVRIAAFCLCALCALVASFQIEMDEMTVPAGADKTVALTAGASALTKPELIAALDEVSDREGLALEKIVVDPDDYLHGRSLYRFGTAHPVPDGAASWYDPAIHGERHAASELGAASLDGDYALSGPASGIREFLDWAEAAGLHPTVSSRGTGVLHLYSSVNLSGTGAALLAVSLLLVAALLTWHAVRARGRALKKLAGVSSVRLVAEETLRLSMLLLVPATIVILGAIGVVALRSGQGYITLYLGFLLPMIGTVVIATLLLSLLIGLLAEPSVAAIASRQPPIRRFRAGSEVATVTILLAALVCVPLSLSSALSAAALTRDAAGWALLRDQVAINNFGAIPGSAEEEHLDQDFVAVVAAADARSDLALSYALAPVQDESGAVTHPADFEPDLVVNPRFLELMGTDPGSMERISVADLDPAHAADLGPSLALQIRSDAGWDTKSYAPLELYRLPDGADLTAISYDDSPQLHAYTHPLIILAREPAAQLTPSFLAAATSQDGVLFGNREHLVADLAANGLTDRATSIDRAADSGLLTLQISTRTMYFNVVAVVLLLGALAFGSWLAATSYVLAHARRLIPMRTSGLSWGRIFRFRVLSETAIAGSLTLITAVVFVALGVPGVLWWGILVPLGYAALTTVFHLSAARRVFAQRLARRD